MHLGDSIEFIAKAEGRRVRPVKDDAELVELDAKLGRKLPAIRIVRSSVKSGPAFVAEGLNRDPNHDNAPRLPYLVDFFNRRVLPMVDSSADVTGAYRVELHDSYSYLPGRHLYDNVLTFGRTRDALENTVALLPDPYHMADFGGIVHAMSQDNLAWEDKTPKLFFAGTTTGNRDPLYNERIKACIWSLGRRDISEMYITKVAQMEMPHALAVHPRFGEVLHTPFGPSEHFPYKYQANIVGNTACWSRLPMVMASNSLLVHCPAEAPDDVMWYYPLMRAGEHYVCAESSKGIHLEKAHAYCVANDAECKAMTTRANRLARDLFHSGMAASYIATLLESSNA